MVDRFYAETYLNSPSPKLGQSKPVKIIAENGKKYYLKTEIVNGEKQNAVFFQELLCSLLAKKLHIPIPNFATIELEKDFVEANAELRFSGKFKPGLYFATEEIPEVEDNISDNHSLAIEKGLPKVKRAWSGYFKNVSNSQDYANIMAFDLFIQNPDRFSNDGNLLIGNENGSRKVFAIDHGHAFGNPYFTLEKIELFNKNKSDKYIKWYLGILRDFGGGYTLGSVFQGMQNNIDLTDSNPFYNIVDKIEKLTSEQLMRIMTEIPDEWATMGVQQKNAYVDFLCRQRYLIRYIIVEMVQGNLFTNHTGGELLWENSNQEKSSGIL